MDFPVDQIIPQLSEALGNGPGGSSLTPVQVLKSDGPLGNVVDIDAGKLVSVASEAIPRKVDLLRVPTEASPLAEVEAALVAMASRTHLPPDEWPIIEVPVLLEQPEPALRSKIEKALEGKGVRLARISTRYTGTGQALADALPMASLNDLQPEDVLRQRWAREHEGEPPADLLAAYHQLLGEAQADPEAA